MEITQAISIPLLCPKCEGEMIAVKYRNPTKIYEEYNMQFCKECDYDICLDEFKRKLSTV